MNEKKTLKYQSVIVTKHSTKNVLKWSAVKLGYVELSGTIKKWRLQPWFAKTMTITCITYMYNVVTCLLGLIAEQYSIRY